MSSTSSYAFLTPHSIFGISSKPHPNILFVSDGTLMYSAGNWIISHSIEDSKQRILDNSTCSLSGGASALAYTDAKPWVAFSDSSIQTSITIIDIHALSSLNFISLPPDADPPVISLSFSSDAHYLLALCGTNTFSLYVYSTAGPTKVDLVKICDSVTPATMASFSPGKIPQIAVTGNNILKLYELEQDKLHEIVIPNPKIGHIYCHLWLNDTTLLCTNSTGDIINVTQERQESVIDKCSNKSEPFVCMSRYKKGFVAATSNGYLYKFEPSNSIPGKFSESCEPRKLYGDEMPISAHSIAVDPQEKYCVVTLINNRIITISLDDLEIQLNKEEKPKVMSYHNGEILSCSTCCRRPLVATCGSDKTVRIWNYLDRSLEIVKEFTESSYCVSFHPDGLSILIGFGDKLRLCGVYYDDIRPFREFSIRGCRFCRFSNGGAQFAAVEGAKIKTFSSLTYNQNTICNRHTGTVNSFIWHNNDTKLASAGHDGSMYIQYTDGQSKQDSPFTRSGNDFIAVAGKSDFTQILISSSENTNSALNRDKDKNKDKDISKDHSFVYVYSTQQSKLQNTLTFNQPQTQLVMSNNDQVLFSGSNEGQITYISQPFNELTTPVNCHTGSITSMSISFDDSLLFTTGKDGVLCIFNIRDKENRSRSLESNNFSGDVMTTRAEIDEKISQIKTTKGELEEIQQNFKMKKELNEGQNKTKYSDTIETHKRQKEKWHVEIENAKKLKEQTDQFNKLEEKNYEDLRTKELDDRDNELSEIRNKEHDKCQQLTTEKNNLLKKFQLDIDRENSEFKSTMEGISTKHAQDLEAARISRDNAEKAYENEVNQIKEMKAQIEDDSKITIEKKAAALAETELENKKQRDGLNAEIQSLNKSINSCQKQVKENKAEALRLQDVVKKSDAELAKLKAKSANIASKKKQLTNEISEKENKIGNIKKLNQELEKYQSVLTHQETMLRQQSTPLDNSIKVIETKISQMDSELENKHKKTSEQNETISEMQTRLEKVIEGERNMSKKLMHARSYFEQAKHDLHNVVQSFHTQSELTDSFMSFYRKYVEHEKIEDIQLDESVEEEHKRQRATLQKQLKELRTQHARDTKFQAKEQARLLEQNAALIEELSRLRSVNKELNSTVALSKKSTQFMPAVEAQRVINENKKKLAALEMQLHAYDDPQTVGNPLDPNLTGTQSQPTTVNANDVSNL